MTVQEAKTKVCPFMSNQVGEHTLTFLTVNCICGDCMAWQYQSRDNWFKDCNTKTDYGYCRRIGK